MEKSTLIDQLTDSHHNFLSLISNLSEEQIVSSPEHKWTPGQQLEHLLMSTRPVRQILTAPKFVLKLFWGKANRPSKTYDQLVEKYELKLKEGAKASKKFTPAKVSADKAKYLSKTLNQELNRLVKKLDKYSESDLDRYIIPHPILGKLTVRELLYFTIYHTNHHLDITKRNLSVS
ncbi:MAG: DinB family protein [Putridiphycobacter sp.]